jgi:NADH-quinone oxidoreductase subunit N
MRAPDKRPAAAVVAGGTPRPAIAGGSAEADAGATAGAIDVETDTDRRLGQPEVVGIAVIAAAATIFFGIYPSPLLDLAVDAGSVFTNLF